MQAWRRARLQPQKAPCGKGMWLRLRLCIGVLLLAAFALRAGRRVPTSLSASALAFLTAGVEPPPAPPKAPTARRVTASMKKTVAARQRWRCDACGGLLSAVHEIDHITPLWRGGTNDASNLHALCRECHGRKTLTERLPKGWALGF